jgi:TM2 domain-containing membrane protein YozV
MSLRSSTIWTFLISFGAALFLLFQVGKALELLLIVLIPSLLILLLISTVSIITSKTASAWRRFSILVGMSLALLLYVEWQLDLSGAALRTKMILGANLYSHNEWNRFTELWDRMKALIWESRQQSAQADEASLIIRLGMAASESGWGIVGLEEDLDTGEKVDLLLIKTVLHSSQGRSRVLSLVKVHSASNGPLDAVDWFKDVSASLNSWNKEFKDTVVVVNYAFKETQRADRIKALARELLSNDSGDSYPIILAWYDTDGNRRVVCLWCASGFTLENATRQACELTAICADKAQEGKEFVQLPQR